MPYPGTNKKAYKIAQSGKTKKARSKIYYREKNKIEQKPSNLKLLLKSSKTNNMLRMTKKRLKDISKQIEKQDKYIPKQLILDDIRKFRSSITISNISNAFATTLVRLGKTKSMTNDQINLLRSSVAFITSETLNKALQKPLKIRDNIKMFVKVGEIIYKVILYFNEKLNTYYMEGNGITTVENRNCDYLLYLKNNPKVKDYQTRTEIWGLLGMEVSVLVDRPLGFIHPMHNDIIYPVNYGYIPSVYALDGEEQDAYILGVNEAINDFKGIVKAIIHRKNDVEDKLVVCSKEASFSKEEIYKLVHFQEKYFDIEIIM